MVAVFARISGQAARPVAVSIGGGPSVANLLSAADNAVHGHRSDVTIVNDQSTNYASHTFPSLQARQRQSSLVVAQFGTAEENPDGEPARCTLACVEEPGGDGNASGTGRAEHFGALRIARSEPQVIIGWAVFQFLCLILSIIDHRFINSAFRVYECVLCV